MQPDFYFTKPDEVSPETFLVSYRNEIEKREEITAFATNPTYENARELSLAIYDVIHLCAPAQARLAIMTSGGKDSSAAVAFYLESVRRRMANDQRYVPATFLFASTGHEFPEMERRVEKECAALNAYGVSFGLDAKIVRPSARNTIMVELIGNGFALPGKATNDKVAAAGVANWCVSRAKTDLLDEATAQACTLAPMVIQVLGARLDESVSRGIRMRKYGQDLPFGLCKVRLSGRDFDASSVFGCYPIGHLTNEHIGRFIYSCDTPHRPVSNMELDSIYSRASEDGKEAGECSIMRGDDGKVLGGCSNLATGTRMGCAVCLKATNKALKNLAGHSPEIYGRLWHLQMEINRHQELVHARPNACRAGGFTPDTLFPRGFTFRQRYRWLVILLAAEIESGFTQLTSEQEAWIERKWARHGVVTVKVSDARKDAVRWIKDGGEVPCFFDNHDDFGDEFTYSVGEGVPLGAFMAHHDAGQHGLNFAHLLGLNLAGGTLFPQLQTYVFEDIRDSSKLLCMVTDTPAILGMRTSTGLINGLVGACFKCIGVRSATNWERRISDGRHFFYEATRESIQKALHDLVAELSVMPESDLGAQWALSDFLTSSKISKGDGAHLRPFLRDLATTHEMTLRVSQNRRCEDAFEDSVLMGMSIHQLPGRWTTSRAAALFRLLNDLTYLSDHLREHTEEVFHSLRSDILKLTGGNLSLLEGDNDEGANLRRLIQNRARTDALTGIDRTYRDYIRLLLRLERFRRAGLANSALIARVAYIVRTAIYDKPYADELLSNLATSLKTALPMDDSFMFLQAA